MTRKIRSEKSNLLVDLRRCGIDLGSRSGNASRNDQSNEPGERLVQTFQRLAGRVVFDRAGGQIVGGAALWVAPSIMGSVV
jgi:hypothetical protein